MCIRDRDGALDQRFLEVDTDDFGVEAARHLERGAAEAAADVEDAFAARLGAPEHFRDVAGTARRHVALAPDELEHGDHIVVVFVFVGQRQRPVRRRAFYPRKSLGMRAGAGRGIAIFH